VLRWCTSRCGQDRLHCSVAVGKSIAKSAADTLKTPHAGTWRKNLEYLLRWLRIGKLRWTARFLEFSSSRGSLRCRQPHPRRKEDLFEIRRGHDGKSKSASSWALRSNAKQRWVRSSAKEQYDRVSSYLASARKRSQGSSWRRAPEGIRQGVYISSRQFSMTWTTARASLARNLWPCRFREFPSKAKRRRFGLPTTRRLDLLRPCGRVTSTKRFGVVKLAARRHRVGHHMQPTLRRSAVGRLQAVRLWTRTWSLGLGGISRNQTGVRQSRRNTDRVVLDSKIGRCFAAGRKEKGRKNEGHSDSDGNPGAEVACVDGAARGRSSPRAISCNASFAVKARRRCNRGC